MQSKKKTFKTGISTKAAINQIKVDSLPYSYYNGREEIIPYGTDNLYPDRIIEAIKKSPTARGCAKREAEFIFGQGIRNDIIVNRHGETLNDVIRQFIFDGYSQLGGGGIHLNFNLLGQICEMFFVSYEFIRRHKTLNKVEYGIWREDSQSVFLDQNNKTVFTYNPEKFIEQVIESGGFYNYNGSVCLYSKNVGLYPDSPIDSASISASFEREAQVYPYANIKNGFSGNTLIKLPTMSDGDEADDEADSLSERIKDLHGAEKAGSSIVTTVPVNSEGEARPFQMVEHLSPTNVDGMFEKQNYKAENNILKCYTMPGILLGVPSEGMFNEASFNDAFNYKNADTEGDRKNIERFFSKILSNSVFGIDKFEIVPLEMKGGSNG
jgi:hypothetical protein